MDSQTNNSIDANVQTRGGQVMWPMTLCAAAVVVFGALKNPYTLPVPDEVIDFARDPKTVLQQAECALAKRGLAPKTWCEPAVK